MRKKILIGVLSLLMLSGLTGCANSQEKITIYGKTDMNSDDINIIIHKGYWVKDYSIDYDKGQVIFNLDKEDNNEKDN